MPVYFSRHDVCLDLLYFSSQNPSFFDKAVLRLQFLVAKATPEGTAYGH